MQLELYEVDGKTILTYWDHEEGHDVSFTLTDNSDPYTIIQEMETEAGPVKKRVVLSVALERLLKQVKGEEK